MRVLQLSASLILICAQTLDTAQAFERNTRRIFGSPRWGRTTTALPSAIEGQPPQDEDGDSSTHHQHSNGRRKVIMSSAAALASALLGKPQQSEASSAVLLEESELRRIATFEKCAPSVVFIDTFAEKQDVFSPNSMEVPIGSGSGFVWDKEGHIGKSFTPR